MRTITLLIMIISISAIYAAEFRIELDWDEFEGECNGFISGTIGNNTEFVNGVTSSTAFNGKLISLGEGRSYDAKQVFLINSEDGYFSFWLKDKFTDDDLAVDPDLITKSKPVISIWNNGRFVKQISVSEGRGLTCKVFDLDTSSNRITEDLKFYPKSSLIVGRILNAIDGKPLESVEILLQDYMKNTSVFVTDDSGYFLFDVDIGEYELTFTRDEFIGTSSAIRMGADEIPREIYLAMSPEIQELRIVLTWGNSPDDLDAHLSGPHPDGGDFHIWYRNRTLIAGSDFLDRDCMNKFGPETITIYKPARGEYFYSIHDYSHKDSRKSKLLSRSNAIVQVFGSNRLLANFTIPTDISGNCWHVFKIDKNSAIIPINNIEFIEDEHNIH